jgi:hypothetical protein
MIPQADLDRALARWKARQAGHEAPTPGPDLATTRPSTAAVGATAAEPSGMLNMSDFDDPDQR